MIDLYKQKEGCLIMRFITCTGYHGNVSSALTDLITEFDGVTSCGNEEFRFVFDSDVI